MHHNLFGNSSANQRKIVGVIEGPVSEVKSTLFVTSTYKICSEIKVALPADCAKSTEQNRTESVFTCLKIFVFKRHNTTVN